jgi:hypothetical protein
MLACERERKKRNTYRVLMGRPNGKRLLDRSSHIWEMILKWILRKQDGRMWVRFIWLWIGTSTVINYQTP